MQFPIQSASITTHSDGLRDVRIIVAVDGNGNVWTHQDGEWTYIGLPRMNPNDENFSQATAR